LIPGPKSLPSQLERPLDYFILCFNDEIVEYLVKQTARYSDQFISQDPGKKEKSYYKNWRPDKSLYEMRAFLASLFYFGIVKFPSIRHHWKRSSLYRKSVLPMIFPRDEFTLFTKFFHTADNRYDDGTVTDCTNYDT